MADFFNNDLKKADNEASSNNVLPAGTYEMMIKDVDIRASKGSNHENMAFDFVVRKDLDKVPELQKTNAKQHGRHLFVSVWTEKDDSGNDSGHYNEQDLQNISAAVKMPEGSIKTPQDYMDACRNKVVRLNVHTNKNTYKGEERDQNSVFASSPFGGSDWHETKYPLSPEAQAQMAAKNPATDPNADKATGPVVSTDDLPF